MDREPISKNEIEVDSKQKMTNTYLNENEAVEEASKKTSLNKQPSLNNHSSSKLPANKR